MDEASVYARQLMGGLGQSLKSLNTEWLSKNWGPDIRWVSNGAILDSVADDWFAIRIRLSHVQSHAQVEWWLEVQVDTECWELAAKVMADTTGGGFGQVIEFPV